KGQFGADCERSRSQAGSWRAGFDDVQRESTRASAYPPSGGNRIEFWKRPRGLFSGRRRQGDVLLSRYLHSPAFDERLSLGRRRRATVGRGGRPAPVVRDFPAATAERPDRRPPAQRSQLLWTTLDLSKACAVAEGAAKIVGLSESIRTPRH